MRTLNISISDLEYVKFGFPSERLSFSEFMDLISGELARERLCEKVTAAERAGLSEMPLQEITEEVKAVRRIKAVSKEVAQIVEAHAYADAIKAGTLKSRPASELLDEL